MSLISFSNTWRQVQDFEMQWWSIRAEYRIQCLQPLEVDGVSVDLPAELWVISAPKSVAIERAYFFSAWYRYSPLYKERRKFGSSGGSQEAG